jgi:hypothetical protein
MNPVEILREINRLEGLMVSKGFTAAKVEISVGFSIRELTANLCYKAGNEQIYKFIHVEALDGFDGLISDVEEYIEKQKSVLEIQQDAFVAAVGRLIDQGKEIGVDVKFLNPLTEMMDQLSFNIITDQSDNVPF